MAGKPPSNETESPPKQAVRFRAGGDVTFNQSRIQCSLRAHDIIIASYPKASSSAPHSPIVLADVHEQLRKIEEKLSKQLFRRCPHVIQFFDQPSCEEGHACLLEVEDVADRLAKERDDLRARLTDPAAPQLLWLNRRLEMLRGSEDSEQPARCWNWPFKQVGCAREMFGKNSHQFLVGFGGHADFVISQSSIHILRRAIVQHMLADHGTVASSVTLPSYRIKRLRNVPESKSWRNAAAPQIRPSLEPEEPGNDAALQAFMLLSFPEGIRGSQHSDRPTRGSHLCRMADIVLGSGPLDSCRESSLYGEHNPHSLRLFLTLSTVYPALVSGRFQNLADMVSLLDQLRKRPDLVSQTCTLLALDDPSVFSRTEREHFHLEDENVSVLLKLKVTSSEAPLQITANLRKFAVGRRGLEAELAASCPSFSEPFFWDETFFIDGRELGDTMKSVVEEVRSHPDVLQTATIPLLPETPWRIELKKRESQQGNEASEAKRDPKDAPRDLESGQPETYGRKRRRRIMEAYRRRRDELLDASDCVFPCYPTTPEAPASNPIARELYDLRLEAFSLLDSIEQLQGAWGSLAMAATPQANSPDTFPCVGNAVLSAIEDLNLLIKLYNTAHAALVYIDRVTEAASSDSLEAARTYFEAIWSEIASGARNNREEIDVVKQVLHDITTAFNERSEAQELVSTTVPFLRSGNQSGIFDLAVDAAGRLFRHYCAGPVSDAPEWRDVLDWRGIVSSCSGHEFSIQPELATLFVPLDFRTSINGRLAPLAHEAGHWVMYQIWKNAPAKREEFVETIWSAYIEAAMEEAEEAIEDEYVRNRVRHTLERRRSSPLWTDEFLIDLLAGLAAGPIFIKSLGDTHRLHRHLSTRSPICHPDLILRLNTQHWLARHLNWDVDGDPWGVFRGLDISEFEQAEQNYLDLAVDRTHAYTTKRIIANYCLFLAHQRRPELIRQLFSWLGRNGKDFLFYPLAREEDVVSRQQIVAWIDGYCQFLAERVMCNDEVLLDPPLRYIAAASELPIARRPLFPYGRIVMSLYYSTNRITEMLGMLQADLERSNTETELHRDQ